MPERAHERLRRVPEPEPQTAPIDVKLRSVALVVIAAASAVALLHWAREVFIPIVLSVLISYALQPIVTLLMRARLPRVIAAALVMILFTGGVLYSGYALSDDAMAMVAAVPTAAAKLRVAMRRTDSAPGTIEQVQKAANELQKTADEAGARNPVPAGVQRVQLEEPAIDVKAYVSWGSAGALAFAGEAKAGVFFLFFLLLLGGNPKSQLLLVAGPPFGPQKDTRPV